MSDLPHSEERYPLLFLFLDDGNKSSKRSKSLFFERNRSHGIMSGATAVLTQWPGQLSSCGLTIIVLALTILFICLMLLASSIRPISSTLLPRCVKRSNDLSNTHLYLVHIDYDLEANQLEAIEEIAIKYSLCNIELILLRNEDNLTNRNLNNNASQNINSTNSVVKLKYSTPSPSRKKRQIKKKVDYLKGIHKNPKEDIDLNINIGAKTLLKAFLQHRRHLNETIKEITMKHQSSTTVIPIIPTINDLIKKYTNIIVRKVTTKDFFKESPLYDAWARLNKHVLVFAARVLKLWENGGISFELPTKININQIKSNISDYYKYDSDFENISSTNVFAVTLSPIAENKIIKSMINTGYNSFTFLPEGLVTVDEEGVHMETKTTCHAFFGEALAQLKSASNSTSVPDVIKNTLKTFCEKGAVDYDYCKSIKL